MMTKVQIEKHRAYRQIHCVTVGHFVSEMVSLDGWIGLLNSTKPEIFEKMKHKELKKCPCNKGFIKSFEFKKRVCLKIIEAYFKKDIGCDNFKWLKKRIDELQLIRNYCAHSQINPPKENYFNPAYKIHYITLNMEGWPDLKYLLSDHEQNIKDIVRITLTAHDMVLS